MTLFNIAAFLKQATTILKLNTIVSLLQPSPEAFRLFDDVILMVEGCVP